MVFHDDEYLFNNNDQWSFFSCELTELTLLLIQKELKNCFYVWQTLQKPVDTIATTTPKATVLLCTLEALSRTGKVAWEPGPTIILIVLPNTSSVLSKKGVAGWGFVVISFTHTYTIS